MGDNKFTKDNRETGIHGQVILDAGINVFALQLLIESFTHVAHGETKPVEFTYRGVKVRLQIDDKAAS